MAHKDELESIIKRRIDKLKTPPEPPKNTPIDDLESDEWVDEEAKVRKAEKAKRKRMNGYNNRQGRKNA